MAEKLTDKGLIVGLIPDEEGEELAEKPAPAAEEKPAKKSAPKKSETK